MLHKLILAGLFSVFLVVAFATLPLPCACGPDVKENSEGKQLRLLSWNIGNGDLETETRAHTDDLDAVAKVILDNDVDVATLQELTGQDQLKVLLKQLNNEYRGFACGSGNGDRVDAVLIRKLGRGEEKPEFRDVPAAGRFAASATFRLAQGFA